MKFSQIAKIDSIEWTQTEFLNFLRDPRWVTMCDLMSDGIVLVDRAGMVQYMNAPAEGLNELTREQCISRSLIELINHSSIFCVGLLDAFDNSKRMKETIIDVSGRRIAVSGRPIRDSRGVMNCFFIVQRNLDSLLRANQTSDITGVDIGNDYALNAAIVPNWEGSAQMLVTGIKAMQLGIRILLLGESGVGKTEFAKLLHKRGGAENGPFVHVNCASIPESLFESEMFGYEKGSFTGANARGKAGLIESADGGTLFLDEIGETPLQLQAKLLQVLEFGMVQRLGATAPRKVHIHVIAATNRDLFELVHQGRFRLDLYYRLSVVALLLPPLRKQPELFDPLIDQFLQKINARRPTPLSIDQGCRQAIKHYPFPGNIREMQNLIEYLAVVCDDDATIADLPADMREVALVTSTTPMVPVLSEECTMLQDEFGITVLPRHESEALARDDLKTIVRDFEYKIIADAIKRTGSKRKAAKLLQTDIATIVRKSRPTVDASAKLTHGAKSADPL
jgi:transcriptional regulator with PAS, ATPase and Fis domain